MRKLILMMLACGVCAPLYARLPPPTPEQQAAAEQKKVEEAAAAKAQQEALTQVQDRLAARFGKGAASHPAGTTERGTLSKKAVEQSGAAGPTGGTAQSAEAHSTPAR